MSFILMKYMFNVRSELPNIIAPLFSFSENVYYFIKTDHPSLPEP